MREIKIICILGTCKTVFTEGDKIIFESERGLIDKHNEILAFEMGLSIGLGGQNYMLPRLTMTQEEFDALKLTESFWGGMGHRTRKK